MAALKVVAVPTAIAERLAPLALLRSELLGHIITRDAGKPVIRAAWNEASIWPKKVERTYRFGPPEALAGLNGFPFHWIYVAEDTYTAVWEAQLCRNDVTRPGTFFIQAGAENALIATLSFGQPLRLLDLTGLAASRLGIYDQLRSPDHAWCQWLGWQLDQIIVGQDDAIHGFVYPSRRHPGQLAYAISSRRMDILSNTMTRSWIKFSDSPAHARLLADHLRADPP